MRLSSVSRLCVLALCLPLSYGAEYEPRVAAECNAKCNGDKCTTGLFGTVQCTASCESDICSAECSGVNCTATCRGIRCMSSCHGVECIANCFGANCKRSSAVW